MFAEGGTTKVWLVGGTQELTELPSKEAGQLYDSESYVVQYTYTTPGALAVHCRACTGAAHLAKAPPGWGYCMAAAHVICALGD